jgi:parvulin-like peptidyl-prolyl isomerase
MNERVDATVLQIMPSFDVQAPEVGPADLDRMYELHRGRFCQPRRARVEVMLVPKRFGDLEVQSARDLAASLVQRARSGEDFAVLARDYSEGPGADAGGVVDRQFLPRDFGTELGPVMERLEPGQVTDPHQDGGRFMIFKLLARDAVQNRADASIQVAQIVVKVRPDPDTQRAQYAELTKQRRRAEKVGLSQVATEAGTATTGTPFFTYGVPPPALYTVPDAADWALSAKEGEVSPVFEGIDEFCIVELSALREAGPAPKDDVADQLRQLAELDARVEGAKPLVDRAVAGVAAGKSLEQVGGELGVPPLQLRGTTRFSPDGRVASSAEVMAALFTDPPGKVSGPFRGINGWYLVKVLSRTPAPADSFEAQKPQFASQILSRRQQAFLSGLALDMREAAKVQDLRYAR